MPDEITYADRADNAVAAQIILSTVSLVLTLRHLS